MKTIIVDGNNLLHRTFHANNKAGDPEDVIISMCILTAMYKLNGYYNTYEPDEVVITFDAWSWRKDFTKDLSKCVTNKPYKGHRRTDKTAREMRMFAALDEHIQEFADMLKEKSSIIVLQRDKLEGDDLMAAWVQMHREDENIVISGDKDMMQLLRYEGVTVIDPATNKPRSLEDFNNDADLFVFEKCFRGEAKTNDNIQSAYPRILRTKIAKAHNDEYLRTEVMAHTFTQLEEMPDGSHEEVEYRTLDLMEENMILMSLRHQPDYVKVLMVKEVEYGKANRGRYNHLKFIKYCTVNDLHPIVAKVEDFIKFLAVK